MADSQCAAQRRCNTLQHTATHCTSDTAQWAGLCHIQTATCSSVSPFCVCVSSYACVRVMCARHVCASCVHVMCARHVCASCVRVIGHSVRMRHRSSRRGGPDPVAATTCKTLHLRFCSVGGSQDAAQALQRGLCYSSIVICCNV